MIAASGAACVAVLSALAPTMRHSAGMNSGRRWASWWGVFGLKVIKFLVVAGMNIWIERLCFRLAKPHSPFWSEVKWFSKILYTSESTPAKPCYFSFCICSAEADDSGVTVDFHKLFVLILGCTALPDNVNNAFVLLSDEWLRATHPVLTGVEYVFATPWHQCARLKEANRWLQAWYPCFCFLMMKQRFLS